MTQRRILAAVLAAWTLVLTCPPVRAHETYRLVGVLTKVEPTKGALRAVTIKFKWTQADADELSAVVYVWPTTKILRDNKDVPLWELRPGLSVVIDALGDEYNYSDAQVIRIVPPIAK